MHGWTGIVVTLALAATTSAADKRPMTVDDALDMVRLGDVAVSPDGSSVLYSERRVNWKKNRYDRKFFMVPWGGGEPVEFLTADADAIRFSPDGRYLSMLRESAETEGGDEKSSQLHVLPLSGGEARPLFRHQGGVDSYRWSLDARHVVFVADEKDPEVEKARKAGEDPIYVDEGPHGKSYGHWSNLCSRHEILRVPRRTPAFHPTRDRALAYGACRASGSVAVKPRCGTSTSRPASRPG